MGSTKNGTITGEEKLKTLNEKGILLQYKDKEYSSLAGSDHLAIEEEFNKLGKETEKTPETQEDNVSQSPVENEEDTKEEKTGIFKRNKKK